MTERPDSSSTEVNQEDRGSEQNSNTAAGSSSPKKAKRRFTGKRIAAMLIAIIVVAGAAWGIAVAAGKAFTAQEQEVRSDWTTETGNLMDSTDEGIDIHSDLHVAQLIPSDIENDGFTYYDEGVQQRLSDALGTLKDIGIDWSASNPLAVLNPFGTGSNGLYLYFETDYPTQVSYSISTPNESTQEWTATARNCFLDQDDPQEEQDDEFSRVHEFQIVGLVPGTTNQVTLTITGKWGNVRQEVTFSIDMPETTSGYPTQLDYADGESAQSLSDGLYALVRQNGYLGYGFFCDNEGTMRYEMVTEGLGLDRILEYDGEIVVCASSEKLARIDGLGRVVQTYDLDGYVLHHDINYAGDGRVVALAEHTDSTKVEDLVIEIDLATGEVTELIDFTDLMGDYVDEYTHPISAASAFFWQAGELDWIHLNTVEYMEEDDSVIVSSRETSTIIKVDDIHESPRISCMVGDDSFWRGTPYEDRCLEQVGDFTPQYGQHSVEYDGEGPTENSYYLLMFDNNYWALSTRDGYTPDLAGTDVSTDMYNGTASHVYRYLVDEEAGTYELVESFDVPYSSIVSNVSHASESDNYVVNSGVAKVFGEYDDEGNLIRQFSYECDLQGYRAFKLDFKGYWFL